MLHEEVIWRIYFDIIGRKVDVSDLWVKVRGGEAYDLLHGYLLASFYMSLSDWDTTVMGLKEYIGSLE